MLSKTRLYLALWPHEVLASPTWYLFALSLTLFATPNFFLCNLSMDPHSSSLSFPTPTRNSNLHWRYNRGWSEPSSRSTSVVRAETTRPRPRRKPGNCPPLITSLNGCSQSQKVLYVCWTSKTNFLIYALLSEGQFSQSLHTWYGLSMASVAYWGKLPQWLDRTGN